MRLSMPHSLLVFTAVVTLQVPGLPAQEWTRAPLVGPDGGTDYQLTRVARAVQLPDLRLVLLDDFARQVHLFGSDGQLESSWGGEGDGPGEFRMPIGLGLAGDSIWVSDHVHGRITYFGPSGDVLGTESGRAGVSEYHLMPSVASFLLADGTAIVRPLAFVSRLRGAPDRRQPILRTLADGSYDTLAALPLGDQVLWIPPGISMPFQPFAKGALYAASADGRVAVVVDRHLEGRPDAIRIKWLAIDGQGKTVELQRPPVALTPAHIEGAVEVAQQRLARDRNDPGWPDLGDRLANALKKPSYHPLVTQVIVAEDGQVWCRREDTFSGTVLWERIDQSGGVTATVEANRSFFATFAREDGLIGVEEDDFGLPWVVRYSPS